MGQQGFGIFIRDGDTVNGFAAVFVYGDPGGPVQGFGVVQQGGVIGENASGAEGFSILCVDKTVGIVQRHAILFGLGDPLALRFCAGELCTDGEVLLPHIHIGGQLHRELRSLNIFVEQMVGGKAVLGTEAEEPGGTECQKHQRSGNQPQRPPLSGGPGRRDGSLGGKGCLCLSGGPAAQEQHRCQPGAGDGTQQPQPPDGGTGYHGQAATAFGQVEPQVAAHGVSVQPLPFAAQKGVYLQFVGFSAGGEVADGVGFLAVCRNGQLPLLHCFPDAVRRPADRGGLPGGPLCRQLVTVVELSFYQKHGASVIPLAFGGKGGDAGSVHGGHVGVEAQVGQVCQVPHGVAAAFIGNIGEYGVVQGVSVVEEHGFQHLVPGQEPQRQSLEGDGDPRRFQKRLIGDGFCLPGNADAVDACQFVGDEGVALESAPVHAGDGAGVLLGVRDAYQRVAAGDFAH